MDPRRYNKTTTIQEKTLLKHPDRIKKAVRHCILGEFPGRQNKRKALSQQQHCVQLHCSRCQVLWPCHKSRMCPYGGIALFQADQTSVDEAGYGVNCDARLPLHYLVTTNNHEASIRNLMQISSAVLANSKRLFLGHILFLLNTLSPTRAEIAYLDTDSIVLACTHRQLAECVLAASKRTQFQTKSHLVMACTEASTVQAGLLKYDYFGKRGLFLCAKCYWIEHDNETLELKRCKGCSRRLQASLLPGHFDGAKVAKHKRPRYAKRTRLGVSSAMQMFLSTEMKKLHPPINVKRRFNVR